jgi:hypothetical protein
MEQRGREQFILPRQKTVVRDRGTKRPFCFASDARMELLHVHMRVRQVMMDELDRQPFGCESSDCLIHHNHL